MFKNFQDYFQIWDQSFIVPASSMLIMASMKRPKENDYLEKRFAELKREYEKDWRSYAKQSSLERKFVKGTLAALQKAGVDMHMPMSILSAALNRGESITKRHGKKRGGKKKQSRSSR